MDSSALLANTAIANVEASLAFTLANKLVDGMLSMDQRPWILAVMCLVFLSLIKTAASSFLGRNAFADMGNQVLILSLSRLVLLQIRFSAASASSPLFEYMRRFLEIAFVVVVLSALAKLLTTSQAIQQQLGTLMVNMQRIFAETVAAIVTDPQIKMLIVLWGLCILPSISKKIAEFKTASSGASFFLVWGAGLGMAWINIAIGLVVSSNVLQKSPMLLFTQNVSILALAVGIRSMHPLLPGIEIFQGFVEWIIASRNLAALGSVLGTESLLCVVCTALVFSTLHTIMQSSFNLKSFYKDSVTTLQAIAAIMFTNSVVVYVMQILAPTSRNFGIVAVALAAGIVVSKTITSVMVLQGKK